MKNYRQLFAKIMSMLLLLSVVIPALPFEVHAGTLPQYWSSLGIKCSDVNCPALSNNDASLANNVFTVKTRSGKLQNQGDTMQAAYTSITGDFTVTARVYSFKNQPLSLADTTGGGLASYQNRAILFVKQNIDLNDSNASSISPGISVIFQPRQPDSPLKNTSYVYAWQNHVTSGTTASNVGTAVSETNPLAGYPIDMSDLSSTVLYFKIKKSTDAVTKVSTYSTFISNDGINYGNGTKIGTALYSFTDSNNSIFGTGSVYVGMGVDTATVDFSDVKIVDAFGNTVFPSSLSSSTPTGLYTTAGNTKATIGWTAVSGAISYNIKRSTTSGGPYQFVANTPSSSYTDSNLVNGSAYYYVVSAVTGSGESPNSFQAVVTPVYTPDPPVTPTGLTGMPRDSQITLQWNQVQGADSYNVLRSSDGGITYTNAALGLTTTTYTDGGLTDGTTYYYAVQSQNVGGVSTKSIPLLIAPVSALASPAGLAVVSGNNKASLTWNSVTGATYYTVKRSTLSGRSYTHVASNLTSPSFTDLTVVNGSTYYYVVSASSAQTESMNSDQVRVIPFNTPAGAPSIPNVTGEAGENQVILNWSTVTNASSYSVKRAASIAGTYTTITSVSGASFVDASATNGSTYYYTVAAVNANGESADSNVVIATPAHMIVVSKDGTGDYTTVQAAVDSIPVGNTTRKVIYIKNGVYNEKISVSSTKPFISFIGQSRDGTIVTYNDYGNAVGTSNSYTVNVAANNFTADNLTIRNTAFQRGTVGPSVALYVTSDKVIFNNVRLAGFQDTLYVNSGRQYFTNSIIEGDVDWIFGNATAFFDNSEIKFVGASGGHTTAASTDQTADFGYVFMNSKLTRGTSSITDSVTVGPWDPLWDIDANINATNGVLDLGRPWRAYANVKYINTWMDAHIKSVGWDNWGNASNEATARYGEYNTTGPGANPKARYKWTSQLTSNEANPYTVQNVMNGSDGWDPTLRGVIPQKPQLGSRPAAPDHLSGILGYSQIKLLWNPVSSAQNYWVYRSSTAGGPFTQIATVASTTVEYTDTTAQLGTTYYYKVSAVNTSGESVLSNEAMISNIVTFDRNAANQANVSVTLQVTGEAVTGIANGNSPLVPTTDFSINGDIHTINKSYLTKLLIGTSTLTFTFSSGITIPVVIQVINTTPLPSQIIANVPALNLYTIEGVAPFLPSIVPVNFTDQTEKALGVTWGNVSPSQYAATGSFKAQGVITGTNVAVTANITVQSTSSVGTVTGGSDLQSYLNDLPFEMPSITLNAFPNRDYNILNYGAVGDGVVKNTSAIASAIAAAAAGGGGRVIVPEGVWLTGPIQLKSNIDFHLDNGATILFSPDYSDYTPGSTRYQPMLSASGLNNIAITGNGVIDGNGLNWRYVKKSKVTAGQWNYLLSLSGVLSDDGSLWYPSQQAVNVGRPIMIDIFNSKNILIDGPTFMNSPQFATSFTSCQYLVIRNTTVNNDAWYQNGDGLDVTSSQNVVLYHNTVTAGDDAIGMKSSNNPSPTNTLANVVIADNIVFHGHGGLAIGSNTSGGIKNLAVRNNQYIGTDNGFNFKSYVGGGGTVENIFIDGIHMQNIVDNVLSINSFYNGHDPVLDNAQLGVDYRVPEYKNIHISNVTVDGAAQAISIDALPNVPVHNLDMSNVMIKAQKGWESNYTTNVQLNNVKITPANGIVYTLEHATDFLFNKVVCPPGTSTFIYLKGSASGIQLQNTDYSAAGVPFRLDPGISQGAIVISNHGTTQVPNAPASLSALTGHYQVFLTWNAVSGADSYTVKRSTTSGTGYQTIATNVTGATYFDTGVNPNTYYYVVTAVNSGGESARSNEAIATVAHTPADLPVPVLTGAASGYVGQHISFIYGLSNISSSDNSAIYAQDLTFQYDAALMHFESAESLVPAITVVSVNNDESGKVRILLANLGKGINMSGDMLKLTWKAQDLEQPGVKVTPILLNKAVISDGNGTESALAQTLTTVELRVDKSVLIGKLSKAAALNAGSYTASSWAVLQTYLQAASTVNSNVMATQSQVDAAVTNLQTAMDLLEAMSGKTSLSSKIAEAQASLSSVSLGDRWGQYSQNAVNILNASISSAMLVLDDSNANQTVVDQTTAKVEAALQNFLNSINLKASIGDLAIISAHYSVTSASSDWVQIKRYDVNHDNKLDIVDLAAIARQILSN